VKGGPMSGLKKQVAPKTSPTLLYYLFIIIIFFLLNRKYSLIKHEQDGKGWTLDFSVTEGKNQTGLLIYFFIKGVRCPHSKLPREV
jgi:hypothetical protein